MKLFDYLYYEDYGSEWYFQLLPISSKFALIDMCIQWDDFAPLEWFPFLIIGIGPRDIGFCFRWRRFELRFDVLDFDRRNLARYRRWKSGDYRADKIMSMSEQERKALEALDKLYEENGDAMTRLAEDD